MRDNAPEISTGSVCIAPLQPPDLRQGHTPTLCANDMGPTCPPPPPPFAPAVKRSWGCCTALRGCTLGLGLSDRQFFLDEAAIPTVFLSFWSAQDFQACIKKMSEADGILVPGGFGDRGHEGKIFATNWARENKKPFLGVCLGMQMVCLMFCVHMRVEGRGIRVFFTCLCCLVDPSCWGSLQVVHAWGGLAVLCLKKTQSVGVSRAQWQKRWRATVKAVGDRLGGYNTVGERLGRTRPSVPGGLGRLHHPPQAQA